MSRFWRKAARIGQVCAAVGTVASGIVFVPCVGKVVKEMVQSDFMYNNQDVAGPIVAGTVALVLGLASGFVYGRGGEVARLYTEVEERVSDELSTRS